ncbi:MAG: alpha/beta fold hydrolase [Micropruina sp.]|nr:MAG: alpha/beta fold hydrolase [Micropruina sp.]
MTEAGTAWPATVAGWGDRFALVAPDQRGHGRSPRFSNAQLQQILPTFVADAIGVLERHGPAVLLGRSLGGRVAAAAAVTRADLVRAPARSPTRWCAWGTRTG